MKKLSQENEAWLIMFLCSIVLLGFFVGIIYLGDRSDRIKLEKGLSELKMRYPEMFIGDNLIFIPLQDSFLASSIDLAVKNVKIKCPKCKTVQVTEKGIFFFH